MYGNLTYFYNPLTWKADAYLFNLKDEIGENIKTVATMFPYHKGIFLNSFSRVLVRIGDTGMWDPELTKVDDEVVDSGRDSTDMAKSFSRYSLLFQQSLNIVIPCNIQTKGW